MAGRSSLVVVTRANGLRRVVHRFVPSATPCCYHRGVHFRCFVPLISVLILSLSAPSWAQSADNKAAAEALFDEGKALVEAGEYLQAAEKFQASQRLDAGIGTLLFLADAFEKAGKLASAWANFREAEALAQQAGQTSREQVAKERADALEGRLPRLQIDVGANAELDGLQVRRGDVAVARELWGSAVPVDPGGYDVTLSAPGHEGWVSKVTLAEGQSKTVSATTPLTAKPSTDPPPPAGGGAAEPGSSQPSSDTAESSGGGAYQGVAIGLTALGAVGLGVGIYFVVDATSKNGDVETNCPAGPCSNPADVALSEDAVFAGNMATVGITVGGAALGAGVLMFLLAPDDGAADGDIANRVQVVPLLSEQHAGLMLGGSW